MNVFVTGGAGYIGSICTEDLLNAGHSVTVYDNLSEGHRAAVDRRARFLLAKPELTNDIFNAVHETKPEAVMHFAACALVPESMTNTKKFFFGIAKSMAWNTSPSAILTLRARVRNSENTTAGRLT